MAKPSFNLKDITKNLSRKWEVVFRLLAPLGRLLFGVEPDLYPLRVRRFIALLIDIVAIIILSIFFKEYYLYIPLIYFLIFEGVFNIGSIGKLIMDIHVQVEDANGNGKVEFKTARLIVRSVMKGLIFYLILYSHEQDHFIWWLLIITNLSYRISPVCRTLYDSLTGTYVNSKEGAMAIVQVEPNRLYNSIENKLEGLSKYTLTSNTTKDTPQEPIQLDEPAQKEQPEVKLKKSELDDLY